MHHCNALWYFSVSRYKNKYIVQISMGSLDAKHFSQMLWMYLTPGSPEGVLSNHPCPSVVRLSVRWSVFKYLRDYSETIFSNFLHEVSAP